MIENIDEVKLQTAINYMVGENASIGVHGICLSHQDHTEVNTSPKEKIASIMREGLRMSKYHTGLTGTIRFLNSEDCGRDILDYADYQTEDENGIVYRVVCAIPEVMEDKNGEKYFLGKYDKTPYLGKDNFKVHGLPTHELKTLPKEFIVGFLGQKLGTDKATFVPNREYYNIQSEERKREIEDQFLQRIKTDNPLDVLPLNEETYQRVSALRDAFASVGRELPNSYYFNSFLTKYESMTKRL